MKADEDDLRGLLYHYMGQDTRRIFKCLENTGTAKQYKEAKEALGKHFAPQQKDLYLMNRFLTCEQKEGESMENFYIRLKEKITPIEVHNLTLAKMEELLLLSQLVAKCKDLSLKKRALRDNLSLKDFLKAARSHETAERDVKTMSGFITGRSVEKSEICAIGQQPRSGRSQIKFRGRSQSRNRSSSQFRKKNLCYCCGENYPHRDGTECPAKGKQCGLCGGFGHLDKACRSKKKQGSRPLKKAQTAVSAVELNSDEEAYTIPQISAGDTDVISVKLHTNHNTGAMPFILDTGSPINIISGKTYIEHFQSYDLKPIGRSVLPYGPKSPDRKPLPMLGCFKAVLKSDDEKQLEDMVCVLEGDSKNLLSRSACEKFGFITIPEHVKSGSMNTVHATSVCMSSNECKELFKSRFQGIGKMNIPPVKLHIDKEMTPVVQRPRNLAFHDRNKVEKELDNLLETGIIEKAEGPTTWVSPIHVVRKENGSIRICLDSRKINEAITRERHPIPTLDDLIVKMNGCKVFSKVDLNKGYHQLELDEESKRITTFVTHRGMYRYNRMLFGLNSAAEIFQAKVGDMVQDIPGVVNISDDIMIGTVTDEQHDVALKELYMRMEKANATANEKKCVFKQSKITFYGNVFSSEGVSASHTKVSAIINADQPNTKSELKSFLGSATYLSSYVHDYANLTGTLRKLLRDKVVWKWGKAENMAFRELKKHMADCQTLSYFDINLPTEVTVDAGPEGLGAILTQRDGDSDIRVVGFGSRSLTDTEKRYSQTEREALGVVFGCEHFHLYLYGAEFIVKTDHKPLLGIMNNPMSSSTARLQRLCLRLQPYKMKLEYIPGKFNTADFLSRHPQQRTFNKSWTDKQVEQHISVSMVQYEAITVENIEAETRDDSTLQEVITVIGNQKWYATNEQLEPYKRVRGELSVVNGLVLRGDRIVIPQKLQHAVVKSAHSSHQGIVKTKSLLRETVWFPAMNDMVERAVWSCIPCQAATTTSSSNEPLKMTKLPEGPWQEVSMDFLGPVPTGDYLCVIIDDYSRFPFVEPVSSTSEKAVIPILDKVFSQEGFPLVLKTDNGPPMNSPKFSRWLEGAGTKHRKITPLWPKANGEAERFMKTLNKAVRTAILEKGSWKQELYRFLRHYRATPHSTTGKSPAEMLKNRKYELTFPW